MLREYDSETIGLKSEKVDNLKKYLYNGYIEVIKIFNYFFIVNN